MNLYGMNSSKLMIIKLKECGSKPGDRNQPFLGRGCQMVREIHSYKIYTIIYRANHILLHGDSYCFHLCASEKNNYVLYSHIYLL